MVYRFWCFALLMCLMVPVVSAQDKTAKQPQTVEQSNESDTLSDEVYRIQIRVIFGGTTGIKGTIPREINDMRNVLRNQFDYASYLLSNTIRLSVFSGEEATALLFPGHYIKITSKGKTKSGGVKMQAEIFEVTQDIQSERFRTKGDREFAGVKEKDKGKRSESIFPVVSSALLLTGNDWEAFGGVPVRVNSLGVVSGNRLSSRPLTSNQTAVGEQKYLILGIQLEAAQ